MNVELIKSMTYHNGKVFTLQCNNNDKQRLFYCIERVGLTYMYNKLGKDKFEKWFCIHPLMEGNYKVMDGSNRTLKKLNYIASLLNSDEKYLKLYNQCSKEYNNMCNAKTEYEKQAVFEKYRIAKENLYDYMSNFYDKHIIRIKDYFFERS